MRNPKINSQLSQGQNRYLVLNLIRQRGPISRVDLAEATGLSTAAMTNISGKLLEFGLIRETGHGESSKGPKPILLEINNTACHVIGVDVGRISIRVGLSDLMGRLITYKVHEFDLIKGWRYLPETIVELISLLNKEVDDLPTPVVGIGIVTPGNPKLPQLENFSPDQVSIPIDLAPFPFSEFVHKKTSLPTLVANATDAAALAEYWYGIAQNVDSVIYLTIGTGVKAGLVVHGEPCPDLDGFTPEFGHTTIDVFGSKCWCGNRGCLELYTSKSAILNFTREVLNKYPASNLFELCHNNLDDLTVDQIIKAYKIGDPAASEAYGRFIRYLGAGAVNLVNLYNPDLLLVGTREMPIEDLTVLVEPLQDLIGRRSLPNRSKNTKVEICSFGENAYLMGGITLVSKAIFTANLAPNLL